MSMGKRQRRKTRRTQLERRNETQSAILEASINLLAEKGYAGFSASRVAAGAGVSRGVERQRLRMFHRLPHGMARGGGNQVDFLWKIVLLRAARSTDPIDKFLADSEHFFFRPVFRAMIEIMVAARTEPGLSRIVNPIVLDARHTLNGIWIETLGAAGYPRERAQQFIELTHYLLRGVFLVSTWLPYEIDRSEIIEVWRRVAPAILELRGQPRRAQRRTHTRTAK